MEKRKLKAIYTQKVAGYLMLKGFVLVRMEQCRDNTNRNVFMFAESDELQNTIREYKRNMNY